MCARAHNRANCEISFYDFPFVAAVKMRTDWSCDAIESIDVRAKEIENIVNLPFD